MKRRIKAILRCLSCSLILCTSLVTSGCNQPEAIPPVSEEEKMEGELTAYYVDYGNPDLAYGSLLPLLQTDFPDLKIDATAFSVTLNDSVNLAKTSFSYNPNKSFTTPETSFT